MFYKFLVIIFCAFSTTVTGLKDIQGEIVEKCAKEVSITPEDIMKFEFEDQMPETDEELNKYKCFFKCYFINSGMMEPDGKIIPKQHKGMYTSCLSIVGADVCDTAFQIAECATFRNQAVDIYRNVTNECHAELGTVREEVFKYMMSNTTETDDEKIKCFFKCLYQKIDMMDEDGNFMQSKFKGMQYTDEQLSHIKPCFNVTGKDLCEIAFNFYVCEKPYFS